MKSPVWCRYRAACIPHPTGCRQCGKDISPGRAYCSSTCSETFERNHFWNAARHLALRTAAGGRWPYEAHAVCARCNGPARLKKDSHVPAYWGPQYHWWPPEVNHRQPVNGNREHFSCAHHQENLEVLCHRCHLKATAEQRAAGLIGRGARRAA